MPTLTENELAPSEEEIEKYATLDLPPEFDALENDTPDETKTVVDFNELLKRRQAVEERLKAAEHINPETDYEGDDSPGALRMLADWFGDEVTFNRGNDLDDETRKQVAEHTNERFNELLDRIKARVKQECGSLGSLNVMIEVAGLLATPEENTKKKRAIQGLTLEPDRSAASYSPGEGKIFVNDAYTHLNLNVRDLIEALAEEGFVSDYETLQHEEIHSMQFPPPTEREKMVKKITTKALNVAIIGLAIKEFGIAETATGLYALSRIMPLVALAVMEIRKRMESVKSRTIAIETQAYYGSAGRFGGSQDINTERGTEHRRMFSSLTEFMEHMSKYEVMRNKGDTDKLIMAYDQIRRLYALGLDDAAVGAVVKKAKWRKKDLSYSTMGEKIEELMQAKGLSVEDVDNLVEAEDIKSIIYFENVKAIAREELQRTYAEQGQLEEARWQLEVVAKRSQRR